MILPDYWLQRPNLEFPSQTRPDIDHLFARLQAAGTNTLIDYTFPIPQWQFVCYLADRWGVVLHGTGDPNIQRFEPRPSSDLTDFGAQTAVYAARDGLWAMFFAILDRTRYALTTTNACIQLVDAAGQASPPRYVFGISRPVLLQQPWRTGLIYLLPGDTFVNQPSLTFGPYEVRVPQCVADPTPTVRRTLNSPTALVRVAANATALVQQTQDRATVLFGPHSALPAAPPLPCGVCQLFNCLWASSGPSKSHLVQRFGRQMRIRYASPVSN